MPYLKAHSRVEVNEFLESSDENIYVVGDMAEIVHRISKKKIRMPLAGPANRQGRIAGSNAGGARLKYNGAIGTSILKIFEKTLAMTGMTEKAVKEAKLEYGISFVHSNSHASYYPGAERVSMKLVFLKKDGQILGAQAFGKEGIDKRIDVIATAIHGKMTIYDLTQLDLAYAPPYSSANDPVNSTGFIAENQLNENIAVISSLEFASLEKDSYTFLDVRNPGEIKKFPLQNVLHIPIDTLRDRLSEIPKEKPIVVTCQSGQRSYIAQRILLQSGFNEVKNLSGGYLTYRHFQNKK